MSIDVQAIELIPRDTGCEITVKVVPGASRTAIAGNWGSALKVAVSAPPEGGKANAAVTRLLAKTFGLKRGDVTLLCGQTQPVKRFDLAGLTPDAARDRLS